VQHSLPLPFFLKLVHRAPFLVITLLSLKTKLVTAYREEAKQTFTQHDVQYQHPRAVPLKIQTALLPLRFWKVMLRSVNMFLEEKLCFKMFP
jgi:hypothetical protein